MINPYVCSNCAQEGNGVPAVFRVRFSQADGEELPLYLCEDCFLRFPPTEFQSIDNLIIESQIERGCCG